MIFEEHVYISLPVPEENLFLCAYYILKSSEAFVAPLVVL
jgi:hypothetical protein